MKIQILFVLAFVFANPSFAAAPKTAAEILDQSPASDWHPLDEKTTVYFDFELPSKATTQVVMQLSSDLSPLHFENIATLIREKYFAGLTIYRVQDNWVVQWGDANADDVNLKKSFGSAKETLPGEFDIDTALLKGVFTKVPDADPLADEVGFYGDFPAGRSLTEGKSWLIHCYGTLGVARAQDVTSGSGSSLYAAIGPARRLDRNYTVVGKVVSGMESFSSLPRGSAPEGGFYPDPAQYLKILNVRFASEVPENEKSKLQILNSNSETFKEWLNTRRNVVGMPHNWEKVDICGISLPTRIPKP